MKHLLLLPFCALILTACSTGDPTTFKVCEYIKTDADAAALTRAWGGLKKTGAMIAFAVNRGIITEKEALLIPANGWPAGKEAALKACFE